MATAAELRREARRLRSAGAAGHRREHELAQLLDECHTVLKIVAAGIWRNKKMNACGLAGAALTVHAVEQALEKLDAYIEDRPAEVE